VTTLDDNKAQLESCVAISPGHSSSSSIATNLSFSVYTVISAEVAALFLLNISTQPLDRPLRIPSVSVSMLDTFLGRNQPSCQPASNYPELIWSFL